MDFTPTEDESLVREAASRLAAKFGDEYWADCDANERFPWKFYDAFAEAGWLGIAVPKEHGGGGLGMSEAAAMLEEVAASGAAMNGCSSLHLTIFCTDIIIRHGQPELLDEIVSRVLNGTLHLAFGVTEPDAGTDTAQIRTFAHRDGNSWVVSGQKIWCSKAQEAQKVLLLARTTSLAESAKRTDGMTLFVADLDPAHVDIRKIAKMGRNAVDSNEVFIDELVVPDSARVGEVGAGFRALVGGFNAERVLLAHEALGIGRAALRRAVSYAKERVVFDRPIGQNQGIQFPLAKAKARLDAAGLLARKAAWLYDRGQPCAAETNEAKVLCADAGFYAADRALQTHGGLGYAREYHVERYFREARLMQLAPVSQELALAHIGTHVLGLPRSF